MTTDMIQNAKQALSGVDAALAGGATSDNEERASGEAKASSARRGRGGRQSKSRKGGSSGASEPPSKLPRLDSEQESAVQAALASSAAVPVSIAQQNRSATPVSTGGKDVYRPTAISDRIATASDQAAVIDPVFGATPLSTASGLGATAGAASYAVYAGVPALARAGQQRRAISNARERMKSIESVLPKSSRSSNGANVANAAASSTQQAASAVQPSPPALARASSSVVHSASNI